jgi:hypothetical protein
MFANTEHLPELKLKQKLILNFTAVSLFMVISSIAGIDSPVVVAEAPKLETTVVRETTSKKDWEVEKIMSTEEYVKEYFKDIPIMIQIARCESTYRHLGKDGEVHRGKVNNKDVGVMQINEYYHLDTSREKDYDIYTIEGNTAYARDLYERQGTQPWSSSKPCWGKYENKDLAINK